MPPKRKANEDSVERWSTTREEKKNSEGGITAGAKRKKADKASDAPEASSAAAASSSNEAAKCERAPNWKICSWNVNGIRAWVQKKGLKFLEDESPDILTVQETKCTENELPSEIKALKGYHAYWESSSSKKGYAGVGLFCKKKPIKVTFGLGIEKHDAEGRVVTAEFDDFYLVGSYVPNSGRGLVRLKYRTEEWEPDMREYLQKLDQSKPIIFTGDLNVSHQEIDLANPKSNRNKTAGFTDAEREEFSNLLSAGFKDSFRRLYPKQTSAYSYWSYMGNARAKNVGWRLDYFVISDRLEESLCDSIINNDYYGSDHCPITLLLSIKE